MTYTLQTVKITLMNCSLNSTAPEYWFRKTGIRRQNLLVRHNTLHVSQAVCHISDNKYSPHLAKKYYRYRQNAAPPLLLSALQQATFPTE